METRSKRRNQQYEEETAAEIAIPYEVGHEDIRFTEKLGGKGYGYAALLFAVLSLFFAPLLCGAIGVVLGFVAIRRGLISLGSWSVGISAFSIIVSILTFPFF